MKPLSTRRVVQQTTAVVIMSAVPMDSRFVSKASLGTNAQIQTSLGNSI